MKNPNEIYATTNLTNRNGAEPSESCRYDVEIDLNSNSTHATVVRLIGTGKRVLELGCAVGHMSRVLRDRGCEIVAIEMDAQAADRATVVCERVVVADLDHMNFERELGSDQFDVVVAADVLEHLKDPASVLRAVKRFLKPDGYVVASLPNVAHLSIRLAVLAGRFPYGETGLLDRTHLRFFTRESAEKLFDDADFAIGHFQAMQHIPPDPAHFEVPYSPAAFPGLYETLAADPEAWTYQFAVVAYPLPHAGLTFVQGRFKQLAREVHSIRKSAADLQRQLEETRRINDKSHNHIAELRAEVERAAEQAAAAHSEKLDLLNHIEALTAAANSEKADLLNRIDALTQVSAAHGENAARLHRLIVEAESRLMVLQGDAARMEGRTSELAAQNEALEQEAAALRESFEDQQQRIAALTAKAEILSIREKDLRGMLLDAHDQLLRRDEEIAAMVGRSLPQGPASVKYIAYQDLVHRIRDVVRQALPAGATVLVISKGDDQLLQLDPCKGWHLPQQEDGVYAGHYPANDQAAIDHVDKLRQAGANYLLIPQTALWWLDHYRGLGDYLNQHYTRVVDQPETCVIFDLGVKKALQQSSYDPPRVAISPSPREFGVNVAGHIQSEKGVGEGARSTIRSLKSAGIPVALNDFTDFSSLNTDTEFPSISEGNPYSINLIHANADCLIEFMEWKKPTYFEGRYNIGFWAWELSLFPKIWSSGFSPLQEVWVPSTFALDSISRVSPIPVVAIPHSLRKLTMGSKHDRASFGLPKDKFLFLFMFDFMSILQRKNPLGLIEAFKKAFKPRDRARLVLKFAHADEYPSERKALEQAVKGASITLIDRTLSREDTNSLMNLCDCYVSLHRSEGFGLTMAEAMSLGKPVIATGYSGNVDFMTPLNSFLVNYRLAAVDRDYGPYPKGAVWADPDQDHAAELMRSVYENRKMAREIGRQAERDVNEKLNDAAVGAIVRARLATLADLGRISAPDEFRDAPAPATKPRNLEYERLVAAMQKLVRSATPAGATVLVISKGDEELVTLDGRQGWHFPRQEDGTYTGYHPSDSAAAIGHLEVLRAKGGQFLLIPGTALWWLDHYADFRQYLENCYRRIKTAENGVLYELFKRPRREKTRLLRSKERAKPKVNGAAHSGASLRGQ